jgi:predicted Zn finger-like uncharacterized protein
MPIQVVCNTCNAEYLLKDEHAGKKVKCTSCETVIEVPLATDADATVPSIAWDVDPAFQRDRFLINQNRLSISEKYYVYDEHQQPILFVERPAFFWRRLGAAFAGLFVALFGSLVVTVVAIALGNTGAKGLSLVITMLGVIISIILAFAVGLWLLPKRHIHFYTDDSKTRLLLQVNQLQKVSILRARYTVSDPNTGLLGRFEKNYFYSIFRKRWHVYSPDGPLLVVAKEDSMILSLLRRFCGPMLGLLRTNFVIVCPRTEKVLGEFNRKLTLFDRYVLDLTADRQRQFDRRMAIALGVMLDTGERR